MQDYLADVEVAALPTLDGTVGDWTSFIGVALKFWRGPTADFLPYLRRVAPALLTSPATSASSERFFSNAAVVDRALLDSQRLEKMAVTRAYASSRVFVAGNTREFIRVAAEMLDK